MTEDQLIRAKNDSVAEFNIAVAENRDPLTLVRLATEAAELELQIAVSRPTETLANVASAASMLIQSLHRANPKLAAECAAPAACDPTQPVRMSNGEYLVSVNEAGRKLLDENDYQLNPPRLLH